jgi:hypothetical protein
MTKAKNIDKTCFHISNAISGKKEYYYLECGEEMQAVKPSCIYRLSLITPSAADIAHWDSL